MDTQWIQRWADLLAGYSLTVQPEQTILIAGPVSAQALLEACYKAVLARGAYPRLDVALPGLGTHFLREASEEQLGHLSPIALYEARHADGFMRILGDTNTRAATAVDPAREARAMRAREPLRREVLRRPWTLTLFPTNAYAQDAEMSLADYEQFVGRAMFLDRSDPVKAWRALSAKQDRIIQGLRRVRHLRFVGPGTDIEMSVEGRTWINSDGRHNMPSGEVFTGPVESSVQGHLRCSFPVCRSGRQVDGIRLVFRKGQVVEASADKNEAYLQQMLDTDAGARRLGELGIGLNDGIDRFTHNILFDEKIGGTVHLALGMAYKETGGTNRSALHWDLILDLRDGGEVMADGKRVMKNGRWRLE